MTFPAQSTFQNGATQSLWWKAIYDDAGARICASQGRTVTKLAQRYLRRAVPVDSFSVDGARSYNTSDLVSDGIPGEVTQAAMVWVLGRSSITSLLAGVRADFDAYRGSDGTRGLPLSQASCAALIWFAQGAMPDLASYEFPSFVPPLWRTSMPDSGPEAVVCFSPSSVPRTSTDSSGGTTPAPSGGGTFNPYDLASFGASSVLGPSIGSTSTTTTTTRTKSNKGALAAAAAIALAIAAAASEKRKKG